MEFCGIIVTYGHRCQVIRASIFSVLRNRAVLVIIYAQAVSERYGEWLQRLERRVGRVKVVFAASNEGPGKGFASGIELAREIAPCDWFALLDDDLCLADDWSEAAKRARDLIGEQAAVICSFRVGRGAYERLVFRQENIVRLENEFLNKSLARERFNKNHRRVYAIRNGPPLTLLVNIDRAPFGGIVINKSAINNVGGPRSDMCLYADDHEWTYRIRKAGYPIYFCERMRVHDCEVERGAGDETTRKKRFQGKGLFDLSRDEFRVYYECRNHAVLSLSDKTKPVAFSRNLVAVIGAPLVELVCRRYGYVPGLLKRIKTVYLALRAAGNNETGVAPRFPLPGQQFVGKIE